jgi:hypothetical protein
MLALRSTTSLGNVRVPCVRILASPHPPTPARAYWQQAAAVRPGPFYRRRLRAEWLTSRSEPFLPPPSVVSHPWRSFRHLASQDAKSAPQLSTTAAAATATRESPQPLSTSKTTISNAEQRRRDWSIVRRLAVHIWPKDDWTTRGRVVLGVGLLIGGKVRRFVASLAPPIFTRSSSLNLCSLLAATECPSPSLFQRDY